MFSGSIVAIITPMNDDGSLDKTSLKRLVNYHVNSGTSAIIAMGTTGESATFEHNEKRDTVRRVIDYADGNIPVIAGVSANSTAKAVSLTQNLEELEVAGCLSVTPYYNKPTQEGLYQHYKTIAENSSLSQILYNVPSRTGCDLLPETVGRLAKIKGIVALKDATGDLKRVYSVRRVVGDDFSLLSGDDATFLDFMVLGGNGTVSVTANIAAREMATICELALNHRTDEARKINDDLLALHNALFIEPNPVPVKWAAMQLGLAKTSKLRLPLTSLSDISKPIVEKALKMAKLV